MEPTDRFVAGLNNKDINAVEAAVDPDFENDRAAATRPSVSGARAGVQEHAVPALDVPGSLRQDPPLRCAMATRSGANR
jgi:hypothetical protein